MSGYGKQAKILTDDQVTAAMREVRRRSRNPSRDCVMLLLSAKAGLRAVEISRIEWPMVLNSEGALASKIALPNVATKGKKGGRYIPMHTTLRVWLMHLREEIVNSGLRLEGRIVYSERGEELQPEAIHVWFYRLYKRLGFVGCSSHSGRRTFITNAARKIFDAGGSLRDVQELAGHAALSTTQRYIQENVDAQEKVVALI